jgi:protein-S-isoprenylcysteine O-methyltransferase Ste14
MPSASRLLTLLLVEVVLMLAVMGAVLFAAAGTLDWPSGWGFLIYFGALSLVLGLWLLNVDPGLLEERMKPVVRARQKPWDRIFMICIGLGFLGWLALMGLDARRFGWSDVGPSLQALGAVLILAAYAGIAWVYRSNSFASPVVRVQAERAHKVVTSGPYALVRHPMYAFGLLVFAGAPLMTGSWAALAVAPLAALAVGVRALGEEQVLATELEGYADYARRVRWRFAPGVR